MKRNPVSLVRGVLVTLCGLWLLVSCAKEPTAEIYTLEIKRSSFEVVVQAKGELRAVRTTPVKPPPQMWQGVISWIEQEGTVVEKDQVVVKMDPSQIKQEHNNAVYGVQNQDFEISREERTQKKTQRQLADEVALIDQEHQLAERFALRDPELYSRHERIDSEQDLALLQKRKAHHDRRLNRHSEKAQASVALLKARRREQQNEVDRYEKMLEHLEIRAPHGGRFYYKRNWRGEVPTVGQTVYSMMTIGEIPDLNHMQAVIWILESEVHGVVEGTPVTLEAASAPGRTFKGKVNSISPLAQAIGHRSPIKYFETVVSLDQTDPEFMIPGGKVTARLMVAERDQAIAIPNQALYSDGEQTYVQVISGGKPTQRVVETGLRSPSRTLIESGLDIGELIALTKIEEVDP